MKKCFIFISMFLLLGCKKDYTDRITEIESFFKKEKTGYSRDYFLVKDGVFGPDKVAVIFGFVDDFDFCSKIAELYMKKYPASSYHCEAAN